MKDTDPERTVVSLTGASKERSHSRTGLAGGVRAHQQVDLARGQLQGDLVEGGDRAVALGQPAHLHRRAHAPVPLTAARWIRAARWITASWAGLNRAPSRTVGSTASARSSGTSSRGRTPASSRASCPTSPAGGPCTSRSRPSRSRSAGSPVHREADRRRTDAPRDQPGKEGPHRPIITGTGQNVILRATAERSRDAPEYAQDVTTVVPAPCPRRGDWAGSPASSSRQAGGVDIDRKSV